MDEVSREFEVRDELKEKRKDIQTFEDLTHFLKDVLDNYNIGYGESPRAMAQAILATAWFFADKFGITGFQAGFVMWDFIRDWQFSSNECGLKITDYDDMLYPQYEDRFEKTITKYTWEKLKEEAEKRLSAAYGAPEVRNHWLSIVKGNMPFGYSVEGE